MNRPSKNRPSKTEHVTYNPSKIVLDVVHEELSLGTEKFLLTSPLAEDIGKDIRDELLELATISDIEPNDIISSMTSNSTLRDIKKLSTLILNSKAFEHNLKIIKKLAVEYTELNGDEPHLVLNTDIDKFVKTLEYEKILYKVTVEDILDMVVLQLAKNKDEIKGYTFFNFDDGVVYITGTKVLLRHNSKFNPIDNPNFDETYGRD